MMQLIKKSPENGFLHKLLGGEANLRHGRCAERGSRPNFGLQGFVCMGLVVFLGACSEPAEAPAASPDRISGDEHFVSGYPVRAGNDLVNMVVEIPAGTQAKWEANKESGTIDWERRDGDYRVVQYLAYPGNYGMLPRTLLPKSLGGDGDPLDILLLGSAVPRGTVLAVKPIGVLRLLDRGEQDDKIIAVPASGAMQEIDSIEALDAAYAKVSTIIELWFVSYKGPGKMESSGYADRSAALQMIEQASAAYEAESG